MIPDSWQPPPPDLAADAKQKAMEALRSDGATAEAAAGRRLQVDQSRLRLLDAAIWTYAMSLR